MDILRSKTRAIPSLFVVAELAQLLEFSNPLQPYHKLILSPRSHLCYISWVEHLAHSGLAGSQGPCRLPSRLEVHCPSLCPCPEKKLVVGRHSVWITPCFALPARTWRCWSVGSSWLGFSMWRLSEIDRSSHCFWRKHFEHSPRYARLLCPLNLLLYPLV